MISIDTDKCTSCERCYDVCPNYVFGVAQTDGKRRTE
ncbi:MAG: 4Fe-4S binding protein, partial [Planctomycetota bacterium]